MVTDPTLCFEFPLGRTLVSEGICYCAIVSFDLYIFCIRMVVRICSDVVASANVEMYLEELRGTVIPIYSAAVGLVSVLLLRRQLVAYGEVAIVSVWQSHEAMAAFFEQRLPSNAASQHTVIRREPITYDFLPC
jgi:heme-degrading monooxygenase HmoA